MKTEQSWIREIIHVFDRYYFSLYASRSKLQGDASLRHMPLKHKFQHHKTHLKLNRKLSAYPLTIEPKENGHRNESQCDEAEQAVSPPKAERIEHGQSRQREHGAEDGAKDGVGCDCGGGVDGEGVDEVSLDGHHCCQVSETD